VNALVICRVTKVALNDKQTSEAGMLAATNWVLILYSRQFPPDRRSAGRTAQLSSDKIAHLERPRHRVPSLIHRRVAQSGRDVGVVARRLAVEPLRVGHRAPGRIGANLLGSHLMRVVFTLRMVIDGLAHSCQPFLGTLRVCE